MRGQTAGGRGQARAFVLNPRDAQASNTVVTGTLTICSKQALVLFDSGATHSFVSPSFALCLDMKFDVLDSPLTVLTPVGEVYLINRFLSGCEVCIEDEILLVDLVELRECLNDGVMFSISEAGGMIAHVQVRSSLVEEVKQLQHDGDFCKEKISQVRHGLKEESRVDDNGIFWLQDCLMVDSSRQHIVHSIPCTLAPSKCIMTYECIIGGKA